jgi:hypothetical protein
MFELSNRRALVTGTAKISARRTAASEIAIPPMTIRAIIRPNRTGAGS